MLDFTFLASRHTSEIAPGVLSIASVQIFLLDRHDGLAAQGA